MDRAPAQRFEDLIVWQKSHQLTLNVYRITKRFPKEEMFGLTAQMRRAAFSVPANIAEAFAKQTKPDKGRVLNIALCSLEELRYYFRLAHDLGYLTGDEHSNDVAEVGRLLGSYTRTIRRDTDS